MGKRSKSRTAIFVVGLIGLLGFAAFSGMQTLRRLISFRISKIYGFGKTASLTGSFKFKLDFEIINPSSYELPVNITSVKVLYNNSELGYSDIRTDTVIIKPESTGTYTGLTVNLPYQNLVGQGLLADIVSPSIFMQKLVFSVYSKVKGIPVTYQIKYTPS